LTTSHNLMQGHNTVSNKTLFICKNRERVNDDGYSNGDFSSGLFNSANFVTKMLNEEGIPSELVHVVDNNGIDRMVVRHRPTHVFIEALWVVPEKFDVLGKIHPSVKWIVRVHSELPFLANEGIATAWLFEYITKHNVYVAFNSKRIYEDFQKLIAPQFQHKIMYLPNHYTGEKTTNVLSGHDGVLDIGCFGAIRPMKNHLMQAVAAIEFMQMMQIPYMRFHINGTRLEQRGDTVLKNLRNLFNNTPNCDLIEHPWMDHTSFINLVSSMDINMQVSLSETFNIVTADAVVNGTPVVVSDEINWIPRIFRAKPTSTQSIRLKLFIASITSFFSLHYINKLGLMWYNMSARRRWIDYLS